ncbi:hypothetical protein JCM18909A_23750 [Cutibacterium acnes subsp. elongatum]
MAVSSDDLAEIEVGVFVDEPCTRTHRAFLPGGLVRTITGGRTYVDGWHCGFVPERHHGVNYGTTKATASE